MLVCVRWFVFFVFILGISQVEAFAQNVDAIQSMTTDCVQSFDIEKVNMKSSGLRFYNYLAKDYFTCQAIVSQDARGCDRLGGMSYPQQCRNNAAIYSFVAALGLSKDASFVEGVMSSRESVPYQEMLEAVNEINDSVCSKSPHPSNCQAIIKLDPRLATDRRGASRAVFIKAVRSKNFRECRLLDFLESDDPGIAAACRVLATQSTMTCHDVGAVTEISKQYCRKVASQQAAEMLK